METTSPLPAESLPTGTKKSWRLSNANIAEVDKGGILEDDVAKFSRQLEQVTCGGSW